MSAIGRPQKRSAQPKGIASCLPLSLIAPATPSRPPTPIAAVMYPTAPAPAWRTRKAATTIRTFKQPRTKHCAVISPMISRGLGARARVRKLAESICRRLSGSAEASKSIRPSMRTRVTRAAATSKAAAPLAKTNPTLARAASAPANSGPRSVPKLSTVDVAPFEAISSSHVRASDGSNACRAGRKSVDATPTRAANAKTRTFAPANEAAAEPARAAASSRAIPSRKRSRRNRSPNDAAKGATTAAGSRRTSPAIPTADVPPTR